MEKTKLDIPEEVLRRLYDDERSTGFDPEYTADEGHVAGLKAIAEWARKEALREAAEVAVSMTDNEPDGYYGQACHEVASALHALAEGGSMSRTTPEAWIQFKGTDICMDVRCECGVISHFDGYQAYAVQCGSCGRKFDLQQEISLVPFSDKYTPVLSVVGGA